MTGFPCHNALKSTSLATAVAVAVATNLHTATLLYTRVCLSSVDLLFFGARVFWNGVLGRGVSGVLSSNDLLGKVLLIYFIYSISSIKSTGEVNAFSPQIHRMDQEHNC